MAQRLILLGFLQWISHYTLRLAVAIVITSMYLVLVLVAQPVQFSPPPSDRDNLSAFYGASSSKAPCRAPLTASSVCVGSTSVVTLT